MTSPPLWKAFPAAHQHLRMRLADEVFPIAPWVACTADRQEDAWRVRLCWPELSFEASERFSAAELRAVYGRWSDWARARVYDIADLLPL